MPPRVLRSTRSFVSPAFALSASPPLKQREPPSPVHEIPDVEASPLPEPMPAPPPVPVTDAKPPDMDTTPPARCFISIDSDADSDTDFGTETETDSEREEPLAPCPVQPPCPAQPPSPIVATGPNLNFRVLDLLTPDEWLLFIVASFPYEEARMVLRMLRPILSSNHGARTIGELLLYELSCCMHDARAAVSYEALRRIVRGHDNVAVNLEILGAALYQYTAPSLFRAVVTRALGVTLCGNNHFAALPASSVARPLRSM